MCSVNKFKISFLLFRLNTSYGSNTFIRFISGRNQGLVTVQDDVLNYVPHVEYANTVT